MDAELQAQLAHVIALINTLDRRIEALDRKLDDMASQLGAELELTDID